MKRISFLVLGLVLALLLPGCGAAEPQPSQGGTLRYDGLYCYIRDFDNNGLTNNYALRFYEDGTVIHASVEQQKVNGNYFPNRNWFSKDTAYYADLLGSYQLDNGKITLTTADPKGTVDYTGTVLADGLLLNSHSNINGFELSNCKYVFFPFDQLPI